MNDKEQSIDEMLARLGETIAANDEEGVQDAIYALGSIDTQTGKAPDEVVAAILELLREPRMFDSPLAGHVLNYFEFESRKLTRAQKNLCLEFLKQYGDRFTHVHSVQVVMELRYDRYGNYLH